MCIFLYFCNSTAIMWRPNYISHRYEAKLLKKGLSGNRTSKPPPLGPPHPPQDKLFLFKAQPVSHL